ncbi:FecR domain-containing protein [Sedimentisphaera salicampi]|uniref:FecR domain-containing protein n=1 Tax=Sedimentisphaera salicampi TaxID=1941349 RepID=UPI000B9B06EF|nr:FecR domain-containing protein [Sedimentisphaera salicampi]OXU16149.1 FecR protein [Sedimentisphaera salicampi]
MNRQTILEFRSLCIKLFEGSLDDHESQRLNELMYHPALRKVYFGLVKVNLSLKFAGECCRESSELLSEETFVEQVWESLAEEEKNAEPAQRFESIEESPRRVNRKVYQQKQPRQISKFNLYSAITGAAALIFLFIFASLSPERAAVKVAAVRDSLDVKFADDSKRYSKGDIIWAEETIKISEGFIEFATARDVLITVEAPAEFEFNKQDDMQLEYGQLYANVGENGIGFTVHTDNMRLIDLGTEFGVYRDKKGWTEVHMIDGEAALVAGGSWFKKTKQQLFQGQARGVSGNGTSVEELDSKPEKFARYINSDHKSVWRGQKTLDLADIVGGGNGLGSGEYKSGIDTASGEYTADINRLNSLKSSSGNRYFNVKSLPFVDGVFIPDGEFGSVQVTSQGHTFSELSDTDGKYWIGLLNGAYHPRLNDVLPHTLTLQGAKQSYPENSALFIHPNQGITFDLNKIRQIVEGNQFARFTAEFGLSDSVFDNDNFVVPLNNFEVFKEGQLNCDLQVLVDGQLRFEKRNQSPSQKPSRVDLTLKPQDRFLTIIVSNPVEDNLPDSGFVWAFMREPNLHIRRN